MRVWPAALLVVAALMTRAAAQDVTSPLDVAGYQAELQAITHALEARDTSAAAARAEALRTRVVAFGHETVVPDPALLAAVSAATPERAPLVARRVRAVAEALASLDGAAVAPPDHALVERLAQQGRLTAGGPAPPSPALPALSIPERLAEAIWDVLTWIGRQIGRFLDWLFSLWPRRAAGEATVGTVSLTLVLVAAALCVLVILAVRTARRTGTTAAVPASGGAPVSAADEDPLSRESDEWERYAHELAAAGRRREAVRAWYHAVLATLFRRGLLEPRKGRTNWEHVATLRPDVAWRAAFADITREFEREWYGRDESTPDALASCARLAGAILRGLRAGAPA